MMAAAIILLVLESHGWWYAGSTQEVRVRAVIPEQVHAADTPRIQLSLSLGQVVLKQTTHNWPAGESEWSWPLEVPEVKQPVRMRLEWVLCTGPDQKVLDRGGQHIYVLPRSQTIEPLQDLAERRDVFLVDPRGTLSADWQAMEIEHTRVVHANELPMRPELVVIAPGTWSGEPLEQKALRRLQPKGLLILRQSEPQLKQLAGLRVERALGSGTLQTHPEHALMLGIERAVGLHPMPLSFVLESDSDPAAWLPGLNIQDAKQHEAESLIWQSTADDPRNMQAAYALTLMRDETHVVLWQVPLKPMQQDPRAALVLHGILQYLERASGIAPWVQKPHPQRSTQ